MFFYTFNSYFGHYSLINPDNYNSKIYFVAVIATLILMTFVLSTSFDLNNIMLFIFPILGGMIFALLTNEYLRKVCTNEKIHFIYWNE